MITRRNLLSAGTAVSLAWLARERSADARCASTYLAPRLRTDVRTPLPADTAYVLRLAPVPRDVGTPSSSWPTSAALVRGANRVSLNLEVLGPSLARLVPAHRPAPGTWTLEGLYTPATIELRAVPLPPMAAPPGVRGIDVGEGRGDNGRAVYHVTLHADRVPPPDFVGVVGYWGAGAGARGSASAVIARDPTGLWSTGPGSTDITLIAEHDRCDAVPPGEVAPAAGSVASVVWVDAYGRLTARSPNVTVVAA